MPARSHHKDKTRILLLENIHDSALNIFHSHGYHNIHHVQGTLDEENLKKELQQAHLVGIRSRTLLNSELLSGAKKLSAIGCFCIGTDQVDLDSAESSGIPVFNAPFSNTRSVAELVLGQAILLLRSIPEKNMLAHGGIWKKNAVNAFEIRGKTLGIIGYGKIGMQLGMLAETIGMNVCFHDTEARLPLGNARNIDSLDNLLSVSDVVSLHVPDLKETQGMITAEKIAGMKPHAVLINASRGKVVDIDALAHALKSNQIMGAAIDVFPNEPKSNQDTFCSPLQNIPNVILTPHIGGSTLEAQKNIGTEVASKLITFCDNGSTLSAINFPEVGLPANPGQQRILHIHENQFGVLAAINHIFSKNKINICGQYLQTKKNTGYVVTDIDDMDNSNVLMELQKIPGTIKARLLHQ